jgi:hypothetical protein
MVTEYFTTEDKRTLRKILNAIFREFCGLAKNGQNK